MISKERLGALRKESGDVTFSDPLTTFLYLLMRDHVPAGNVESIVHEVVAGATECVFTNGWLAKYANNLAEMIKNSKQIQLEEALKLAFTDAKIKEKEKVVDEDIPKEEIEDEILIKLEQKIKDMKVEEKEEAVEQEEDFTTIEDARMMVEQLKVKGHIKDEDAVRLQEELDEVIEDDAEFARQTRETYEAVVGIADVDPVDTEITEDHIEKWKKTNEELQKIDSGE